MTTVDKRITQASGGGTRVLLPLLAGIAGLVMLAGGPAAAGGPANMVLAQVADQLRPSLPNQGHGAYRGLLPADFTDKAAGGREIGREIGKGGPMLQDEGQRPTRDGALTTDANWNWLIWSTRPAAGRTARQPAPQSWPQPW